VPERPAVNASPLICLARAGFVHLLRLAGEQIVVPKQVAEEILRRGPEDPTARAIHENPWLVVTEVSSIPSAIQAWGLGDGEASVLAWGLTHPGAEVIIDDLAGRRCAAALGLPVRGTLGLVLEAKEVGKIILARPVLSQLRQAGMYLSESVVARSLAEVGEA